MRFNSTFKCIGLVVLAVLLRVLPLAGSLSAQPRKQKGQGSQISGRVVDSLSARGIAFAEVQVATQEGEMLGGAICDSLGVFRVRGVPSRENGQVTIQALGYKPKTLVIDIASTRNNDFFLGDVLLSVNQLSIERVMVEGTAPFLVLKPNRKL